jgi:hypothetical protein
MAFRKAIGDRDYETIRKLSVLSPMAVMDKPFEAAFAVVCL